MIIPKTLEAAFYNTIVTFWYCLLQMDQFDPDPRG